MNNDWMLISKSKSRAGGLNEKGGPYGYDFCYLSSISGQVKMFRYDFHLLY
jgi:hypothetical protein